MAKKMRSDAADLLKAISKPDPEEEQQPEEAPENEQSVKNTDQAAFNLLEQQPKEQLNTSVNRDVKRAITIVQQDVMKAGHKKPKIGDVIEQAIFDLLESRGLSLD